jgi:glutathione S-transferase
LSIDAALAIMAISFFAESPMKLYYTPGTCALSDHIALEWIGKPFEAQLVTREQRTQPEYLQINPAGAVPALESKDGTVLLQNVAILN